MKTLVVALPLAAMAAFGGWMIAAAHRAAPVAVVTPVTGQARAIPPALRPVVPAPVSSPPIASAKTDSADAAGNLETQVAAAVDRLASPQTSYGERIAMWDSIRGSGQLDNVVLALKRLANDNPHDTAAALALAEGEINQLRVLSQSGANLNQVGLVAMQADEDFNAVLAEDPSNWAAQFEKAATLSRWPPGLNKGPEVVTLLTSLVAQQENLPARPEYAQTYVVLGDQYAAAGDTVKAQAMWQQGQSRFPANPAFQTRLMAKPSS